MSNLKGSFFPYQVIPSKALGALGAKAVRDGVLTGCAVSFTGTALTIGKGFLIACGRVMEVPGAVTLAIDGATSGYARVSVKIDTAKTSTRETFEQADFLVEYSSTEDGFTEAYAEDINLDGTLYQLPLCVVSLSAAGVAAVVEEAEPATAGGLQTVWENAAPTSNFAAQTLTVPGLKPGAMLFIDWFIDPTYINDLYTTIPFQLPDAGEKMSWQSFNVGNSNTLSSWVRTVTANVDDGTLTFKEGVYTAGGSSHTYQNIMIPQRIRILT